MVVSGSSVVRTSQAFWRDVRRVNRTGQGWVCGFDGIERFGHLARTGTRSATGGGDVLVVFIDHDPIVTASPAQRRRSPLIVAERSQVMTMCNMACNRVHPERQVRTAEFTRMIGNGDRSA